MPQAAGPSIFLGAELTSVLPEREATFFWWPGSSLFGLPSRARQGAGPRRGRLQILVLPSVWLGVSSGSGRPVFFLKWVFYVDESTSFEERRAFACMGAPLLQAAGPSIFRGAELTSVLPEREATFLWPPGLSLFGLPSWARQGTASGVTPAGIKVRKVVFCVSGSTLMIEIEPFTYTGAAVPCRSGTAFWVVLGRSGLFWVVLGCVLGRSGWSPSLALIE